ncbi:MAG: hypothetical protein GY797_28630 [Deltaproteobacteria bacterium]|nr:hypothetical protein [Deltaproteobacteria bacterium]
MSRAELNSIKSSGVLSRGGRSGPHFVTDAANKSAKRARQRLSLSDTPELRASLEVQKDVFSVPSKIQPKFNMSGGGLERTAPGHLDIPVNVIKID